MDHPDIERWSSSTEVLPGRPPSGSPVAVIESGDLHSSGVSWGAVIGGAFVAAALALILWALGAGFGLAVVSPWSSSATVSTIGTAAIIWLILTEAVASGMGGYLSGRLRTKWRMLHTDEVHFRDTANGFLAWAVAVVLTIAFLGTAAVSMAGGRSGEDASSSAVMAAESPSVYYVDRLFWPGRPGSDSSNPSAEAEAAPIMAKALRQSDLPGEDLGRLVQLVVARTGLTAEDAQKWVTDTISSARQAEDAARKEAARVLLWTFVALLAGAFSASYAATVGGRQRDRVKAS